MLWIANKLNANRRHEGQYLLCSNLSRKAPARNQKSKACGGDLFEEMNAISTIRTRETT